MLVGLPSGNLASELPMSISLLRQLRLLFSYLHRSSHSKCSLYIFLYLLTETTTVCVNFADPLTRSPQNNPGENSSFTVEGPGRTTLTTGPRLTSPAMTHSDIIRPLKREHHLSGIPRSFLAMQKPQSDQDKQN